MNATYVLRNVRTMNVIFWLHLKEIVKTVIIISLSIIPFQWSEILNLKKKKQYKK